MTAPDLFELHQQMAHWAYVQAQAHPLESNAWLQVAYWFEALCWMTPGVFLGWWCHRLLRGESWTHPRMHERGGRRFELHSSGAWMQHMHDPDTGQLSSLKVLEEQPIGAGPAPDVKLTSRQQYLKRARG